MKKYMIPLLFLSGFSVVAIHATGIVHQSFDTLETELTQTNDKIAHLSAEMNQLKARVHELELQRDQLNAGLVLK